MISLGKLSDQSISISKIDKHDFICDLIYFEGPLLTLFRDKNESWLYLWCDTDNEATERWLLFPVSRENLVNYLKNGAPLLNIIKNSYEYLILDLRSGEQKSYRFLRRIDDLNVVNEYLPDEESVFNESLAPDISLAMEVTPTKFNIPLDSTWFITDLQKFTSEYANLYAFFYCAIPRFITNIGERVQRCLAAPWKGGFSRVNFFDALERYVPPIHELEIKRINYASPGEIEIEALESIGNSIANVITSYIKNESKLIEMEKAINALLTSSKLLSSSNLKRTDVSKLNDQQLILNGLSDDKLKTLIEKMDVIARLLSIQGELSSILKHSPNSIVTSKVVLTLLARIKRIAEFQKNKQIKL